MKRMFDIVISLIFLVVMLPILLIVAFKVKKNLGSPVLFRQQRPGRGGVAFQMVKFRTMKDAIGADGRLLPDEERMTDFGRRLRNSSLDELPELWNVLLGDMSLVGPRPLLMQYLSLYNTEQYRRHDVRPGITGWAQVNGRNSIDWDEKFKLDVWYVDNQSFWLDVKILAMTVKKVFAKEGISSEGHATTPPFTGQERKDDANG